MLDVLTYAWWMAALIQSSNSTGKKIDKQGTGLEKKDIFFSCFPLSEGSGMYLVGTFQFSHFCTDR